MGMRMAVVCGMLGVHSVMRVDTFSAHMVSVSSVVLGMVDTMAWWVMPMIRVMYTLSDMMGMGGMTVGMSSMAVRMGGMAVRMGGMTMGMSSMAVGVAVGVPVRMFLGFFNHMLELGNVHLDIGLLMLVLRIIPRFGVCWALPMQRGLGAMQIASWMMGIGSRRVRRMTRRGTHSTHHSHQGHQHKDLDRRMHRGEVSHKV